MTDTLDWLLSVKKHISTFLAYFPHRSFKTCPRLQIALDFTIFFLWRVGVHL